MTLPIATGDELRRTFERELLYGDAHETIAALLQHNGISQRGLAARLGLSEARVSRILNGRDNTTQKAIADLGWALDVRFTLVGTPLKDPSDTPAAATDRPPPEWLANRRQAVAQPSAAPGPPRRER